jgi:hypothetical protein
MPISTETSLIAKLSSAKHALSIVLDIDISNELIDELQALLQKGLALNLIISREQILNIESEPFKLHKLLGLRAKGAGIYDGVHSSFSGGTLLMVDFLEIHHLVEASPTETVFTEPDDEFYKWFQFFNSFFRAEKEYRLEKDDITVKLNPQSTSIFENDKLELSWDVKNAALVRLHGMGNVKPKDSIRIKLEAAQFLKIEASNDRQRKIEVIKINVISDFKINYDVQFLNPSSKKFTSIEEENKDGVFGVISGQKIRLCWDIPNAQTVEIRPIGNVELKGTFEFLPEAKMEFSINAKLNGKLKQKKIIIQKFPVPIFTENFNVVSPLFELQNQIEIIDKRPEMAIFLEKNGYSNFEEQTAELRRNIENMSDRLYSNYSKIEKSKFGQQEGFNTLKNKVNARMINYFKQDPSHKEILLSIKKYYD